MQAKGMFFPGVTQMVIGPLLLVLLSMLPACGHDSLLNDLTDLYVHESDTTSGSVGPFVETANIQLTATSFFDSYDYPGQDGLHIALKRQDTLEPLRIGTGDSLRVTLGGVSVPLHERRTTGCDGPLGPCSYIYSYYVVFDGDPSGLQLTLDFERLQDTGAITNAVFPPRPTISQPTASDVISLSTDTLTVTWNPGDPGDELEIYGSCGVYDYFYFPDPTSTYSLSPGFFHYEPFGPSCTGATATEQPLSVLTRRYRSSPAAPELGPGSSVDMTLESEVDLYMQP